MLKLVILTLKQEKEAVAKKPRKVIVDWELAPRKGSFTLESDWFEIDDLVAVEEQAYEEAYHNVYVDFKVRYE
jgi:hypothetical protein